MSLLNEICAVRSNHRWLSQVLSCVDEHEPLQDCMQLQCLHLCLHLQTRAGLPGTEGIVQMKAKFLSRFELNVCDFSVYDVMHLVPPKSTESGSSAVHAVLCF